MNLRKISLKKFTQILIKPTLIGIAGFLLFISVILVGKTLTDPGSSSIENEDILLSSIGFVLMFISVFTTQFSKDH